MKVFFDTNALIAASLTDGRTLALIRAADKARWRLFASEYVVAEISHVMCDYLGFSTAEANRASQPVIDLLTRVETPVSRHAVVDDPKDSPILRAALGAGADFLVSDDRHLLEMDPYEGLRIINLQAFDELLRNEGLT